MLSNNIQIKNGRLIPTNVFTRDANNAVQNYKGKDIAYSESEGKYWCKVGTKTIEDIDINKLKKKIDGESKDASPTESLLYAIELNKKAGNTELVEKLEKELAITKEKGLDSKTGDAGQYYIEKGTGGKFLVYLKTTSKPFLLFEGSEEEAKKRLAQLTTSDSASFDEVDFLTLDPLTDKGKEIMAAMKEQYGAEKGEQVFFASKQAGKLTGVDTKDVDIPANEMHEVHTWLTMGNNKLKDLFSRADKIERIRKAFPDKQRRILEAALTAYEYQHQ